MTESSTGASGITVKTSLPKIIIEIGVTVPSLLARDHGNAPQWADSSADFLHKNVNLEDMIKNSNDKKMPSIVAVNS